MRAAAEGAFAVGLPAGFAEAAGAAGLETWVLLFVAVLFVNLPALVLEGFAEAPAFRVEVCVETGFEEEEGLLSAGFLPAAGVAGRLAVVGFAMVKLAFADLTLSAAPLIETGAFVF